MRQMKMEQPRDEKKPVAECTITLLYLACETGPALRKK
jgi:hypothetical protein